MFAYSEATSIYNRLLYLCTSCVIYTITTRKNEEITRPDNNCHSSFIFFLDLNCHKFVLELISSWNIITCLKLGKLLWCKRNKSLNKCISMPMLLVFYNHNTPSWFIPHQGSLTLKGFCASVQPFFFLLNAVHTKGFPLLKKDQYSLLSDCAATINPQNERR